MTDFMTLKLNNKSNHDDEEIVEQVGTSLLNGLGNLLDITAHEAKEDSGEEEEESLVVISSERKQKVRDDFVMSSLRSKCFRRLFRTIEAFWSHENWSEGHFSSPLHHPPRTFFLHSPPIFVRPEGEIVRKSPRKRLLHRLCYNHYSKMGDTVKRATS